MFFVSLFFLFMFISETNLSLQNLSQNQNLHSKLISGKIVGKLSFKFSCRVLSTKSKVYDTHKISVCTFLCTRGC